MEFLKKLLGKFLPFAPKDKPQGGSSVFSVEDRAVLQSADPKVVVGKILSIRPHQDPKVTRVRVTECDLGCHKEQILCGGSNIVEGALVVVATVGAQLAEDFIIGERDIRGEMSRGMICARKELGLDAKDEGEHDIWILPGNFGAFLGKSVRDL